MQINAIQMSAVELTHGFNREHFKICFKMSKTYNTSKTDRNCMVYDNFKSEDLAGEQKFTF